MATTAKRRRVTITRNEVNGKLFEVLRDEAKEWLVEVLGPELVRREVELQTSLKDGSILCKLAQRVEPGCIPKYHEAPRTTALALENMEFFLAVCRRWGLPGVFVPLDLYDGKNMIKVVGCIHSFAACASNKGFKIPMRSSLYRPTAAATTSKRSALLTGGHRSGKEEEPSEVAVTRTTTTMTTIPQTHSLVPVTVVANKQEQEVAETTQCEESYPSAGQSTAERADEAHNDETKEKSETVKEEDQQEGEEQREEQREEKSEEKSDRESQEDEITLDLVELKEESDSRTQDEAKGDSASSASCAVVGAEEGETIAVEESKDEEQRVEKAITIEEPKDAEEETIASEHRSEKRLDATTRWEGSDTTTVEDVPSSREDIINGKLDDGSKVSDDNDVLTQEEETKAREADAPALVGNSSQCEKGEGEAEGKREREREGDGDGEGDQPESKAADPLTQPSEAGCTNEVSKEESRASMESNRNSLEEDSSASPRLSLQLQPDETSSNAIATVEPTANQSNSATSGGKTWAVKSGGGSRSVLSSKLLAGNYRMGPPSPSLSDRSTLPVINNVSSPAPAILDTLSGVSSSSQDNSKSEDITPTTITPERQAQDTEQKSTVGEESELPIEDLSSKLQPELESFFKYIDDSDLEVYQDESLLFLTNTKIHFLQRMLESEKEVRLRLEEELAQIKKPPQQAVGSIHMAVVTSDHKDEIAPSKHRPPSSTSEIRPTRKKDSKTSALSKLRQTFKKADSAGGSSTPSTPPAPPPPPITSASILTDEENALTIAFLDTKFKDLMPMCDQIQDKESRLRMKCIVEIFQTELDYVRDLSLLSMVVFFDRKRMTSLLTGQNRNR